jgi:hypothetical protein
MTRAVPCVRLVAWDRSFYVGIEGVKRNVSLAKVFALANALGFDVSELFNNLNGLLTDPTPEAEQTTP